MRPGRRHHHHLWGRRLRGTSWTHPPARPAAGLGSQHPRSLVRTSPSLPSTSLRRGRGEASRHPHLLTFSATLALCHWQTLHLRGTPAGPGGPPYRLLVALRHKDTSLLDRLACTFDKVQITRANHLTLFIAGTCCWPRARQLWIRPGDSWVPGDRGGGVGTHGSEVLRG